MNYFDKELEKAEKTDTSGISSNLLWIDAIEINKSRTSFVWFFYLVLIMVLLLCFYLLSCTIFGFGWIKNIFENKTQSSKGNFEFVLPLADKPALEGDGLYTADGRYTPAGIAELMKDSAVTIYAYDKDKKLLEGQGSGFVFTEDGYIITNAHVVYNGKAPNVTVRLSNNSYYNGMIVGVDTVTDIAVLKIQASGLSPVVFGDSNQLKQGEEIIAYGNPAGLTASISSGIVSALGRDVSIGDMRFYDAIQIDAAINPGNSGGALLNMWGQVVGVVSAKLESSDYDGIGFAISSAEAKPVIESIIENGCVVGRVRIGIEFYEISEEQASTSDEIVTGLLIMSIDSSCDISNSGLLPGDIITVIDGKKVESIGDVNSVLNNKKPGDKLTFTYVRNNTEYQSEFKLMEANKFSIINKTE